MKQILMANDLSARSDRALRRAVSLAKEFGAKLEVLTVVEEMFLDASTRNSEGVAEEALAKQISGLPDAVGVSIATRVSVGMDYEDIIQRSEELDADLVVLGIHRQKTRELFRGTTAERVVRFGNRPVLIVKHGVSGPYRKALLATDLSVHAQAATEVAARIVPKGEIVLLHAVHRPFAAFLGRSDQKALMDQEREQTKSGLAGLTTRLTAELGDQAPRFDIVLPEGEVRSAIYSEVANLKPDLLVVGTHGRSGIAHALIGSIAEQLLADCPIDVLAVKARGALAAA